MPLFEYECNECGCRMELIQKVGARPLKKVECDDCRVVRPVTKLLSAPAFQFKGEGWYVTDYADKKASKSSNEGDAGSEDSKSAEKGKESKADKDGKTKSKSEGKKKGGDSSKASKGDKGSSSSSKKSE